MIGFDDWNNAGFTATSAAIEDAGGLMVAHYGTSDDSNWHRPNPRLSPTVLTPTVGPSPCYHGYDEIHDLITKFAATAARLQGRGLAGVELHGARRLFDQLPSPWSVPTRG